MKRFKSLKLALPSLATSAVLGLASIAPVQAAEDAAGAGDFNFALSGYARAWLSFNLEQQSELSDVGKNSKWAVSMLRGSVLLDADATYAGLKFKAITRLDREYRTGYLKDLQKLRSPGQAGVDTSGGKDITENYNNFDFRELWVEAPLGDRTTVKFGRQQLVWGESDFFQALDLVHGYDFSWRLFFEGENEEWRKPLILLSTKIRVPEYDGLIAAFIRPGWDRCSDIGNTYDISGGRWFFQPYRGFDLTQVTDKNCEHKSGDQDDITGGIRWQAEAFGINYSIAYVKTFAADPVANVNSNPFKGDGGVVAGNFFDRIHPEIDVIGLTLSGYSDALDSVLSAEMAYIIDQPYNVGTGGFLAPDVPPGIGIGLDGIKEKDALRVMVRADKNLNFQDILGTTRPSFSSIQIFNTTILNFKKSDDLVRLFAYGSRIRENNTIFTAFTVLNYRNDEINPGFAVGFDLSNGGGFAIPSVAFTLSDAWVGKVEADIFWSGGRNNKNQFSPENSQLFGYFEGASQLAFRLTRQF